MFTPLKGMPAMSLLVRASGIWVFRFAGQRRRGAEPMSQPVTSAHHFLAF